MQSNKIEYYNYITAIADALTKYNYIAVKTDNIQRFLADLYERHGIKAFVKPQDRKDDYFIFDQSYKGSTKDLCM